MRLDKLAQASSPSEATLHKIAQRRMRVSLLLTAIMSVCYVSFALLMAFAKDFLAHDMVDGISRGIVLSFLLMLIPWILSWIYVSWANRHYDKDCDRLSRGGVG